MKTYRMTKVVPMAAGTVVRMNDAQAQDRKGRVEALGGGRYRLNELLAFKAGEVVGIEGALPKVHQELLEPVGGAGVEVEAKAEADVSVDRSPMIAKPMGGGRQAKKGY
jgi:ABC-type sugar transport system ATPase subunit